MCQAQPFLGLPFKYGAEAAVSPWAPGLGEESEGAQLW